MCRFDEIERVVHSDPCTCTNRAQVDSLEGARVVLFNMSYDDKKSEGAYKARNALKKVLEDMVVSDEPKPRIYLDPVARAMANMSKEIEEFMHPRFYYY